MDDSVIHMKNIGEAKMTKLVSAGVRTVKDISNLSDDAIMTVSQSTNISKKNSYQF
jgi:predicted Fe-Mo cluster-binding NifX family protein